MRTKIVEGEIYHICNKSIANFGIFKNTDNAVRFIQTLDYYNNIHVWTSFSQSLKSKKYQYSNIIYPKEESIIKIMSYCIMSDHYHLLFKVLQNVSISKYINDIENSYTRYFNIKFDRKGPLWQSQYRIIQIISNEQLLHVSRYIHLNLTTNGLVENPEDWQFSSYKDIITSNDVLQNLTEFSISNPNSYKKFVENNLDYQKTLKLIKRSLLE